VGGGPGEGGVPPALAGWILERAGTVLVVLGRCFPEWGPLSEPQGRLQCLGQQLPLQVAGVLPAGRWRVMYGSLLLRAGAPAAQTAAQTHHPPPTTLHCPLLQLQVLTPGHWHPPLLKNRCQGHQVQERWSERV
jgi:hypothetical protein